MVPLFQTIFDVIGLDQLIQLVECKNRKMHSEKNMSSDTFPSKLSLQSTTYEGSLKSGHSHIHSKFLAVGRCSTYDNAFASHPVAPGSSLSNSITFNWTFGVAGIKTSAFLKK